MIRTSQEQALHHHDHDQHDDTNDNTDHEESSRREKRADKSLRAPRAIPPLAAPETNILSKIIYGIWFLITNTADIFIRFRPLLFCDIFGTLFLGQYFHFNLVCLGLFQITKEWFWTPKAIHKVELGWMLRAWHYFPIKMRVGENRSWYECLITCLSLLMMMTIWLTTTPNDSAPPRLTCLRTLVNPAARQTDNAAELPSPAPMGISLHFVVGQVNIS